MGPQGPPGPGVLAAAYIYSTDAQTVANGAPVVFNSSPSLAPIAFAPPSSSITLSAGTYLINFVLSYDTITPAVFGIGINGIITQANTYVNRENGTQLYGQALITLGAAAVISLINATGMAVNLSNGLPMQANAVSASMTILKIA
ncbi:MAG TPA: hypothetical protein PKH08_06990 [Clostridia bacterium]|nr:hypothetical protein [Clostridia bacterium]HOK81650.1 hypothetical protein [Clostridia bacterium]HOL60547.1 hypothetical protein [Clostridia bacterium]HPO52954.1 hypothetical protein [Clostridia bacterium]